MRKQLDAALLARAQNLAVLVQSSILDPLSRDNALRAWVADPQIAGAFLGPQGRDRCNRFLAAATRGRVVVGGGAARSRGTAGVHQRRGPGLAGGSRRRLVSRRSRRHSRQRGDRPRSARTCPFAGHRRPRRRIASRRAARLVRLGRDRTDDRGPGCAGADVRRRAAADLVGPRPALRQRGKDATMIATGSAARGAGDAGNLLIAWARNDTAPTDPGGGFAYVCRVQRAVAFASLRQLLDAISRTMTELGESTARIAGITGVVKDLADQSNMLALNAAIEAVRSGEHGRGFAVVAREIRSLADQSIKATQRVHENLEGIRLNAARAVSITEQGSRGIAANLTRVRGSGDSLRELGTIARGNAHAVREIAAAVGQQNAGIDQVFSAVRDLSSSMTDLVQLIAQSADSVRELGSVSARIGGIVSQFRV